MFPNQGGFSFGNLSGPQSIFYNDPNNRGVGWQMLKDYLNRSGNQQYDAFLNSRMGTEYNRYLSEAARRNGNLNWTDWMVQRQNQYADQWRNTPTAQKGGSLGLYGNNQIYLG